MAAGAARWWSRVGGGPRLLPWRQRLLARLTLDTRALALLRIGLGLTLLSDVLLRWPDIEALYADGGVIDKVPQPWERTWFALYDAFGAADQVRIWFALTALLALLITLGVRTRVMMLLGWWLVSALQVRNGLVLQDGDYLLQQLLLLGALLPCGERWSLDAHRRGGKGPALRRCVGPATGLLIFQMVHLYMSTGITKLNFAHWWHGEGVAHGLQADYFTTPLGVWLRDSGLPLAPFNWFTLIVETLGPLIWLLAPPGSRTRNTVWLAFVALHLGIASTLHVGLFSLVCLVMWLFALPSEWLDRLELKIPRRSGMRAPQGKLVACVPRRRALHVASIILLLYLPLAAAVADYTHKWSRPVALLAPAERLLLRLRWAVFSGPRLDTGWFLVAASLPDGQRIDLISGEPLSLARPTHILATLPNQRWRKLWLNFRQGHGRQKQAYLRWLCRQHPEARSIEMIFMKRTVVFDGTIPEAKPERMGYQVCRR